MKLLCRPETGHPPCWIRGRRSPLLLLLGDDGLIVGRGGELIEVGLFGVGSRRCKAWCTCVLLTGRRSGIGRCFFVVEVSSRKVPCTSLPCRRVGDDDDRCSWVDGVDDDDCDDEVDVGLVVNVGLV